MKAYGAIIYLKTDQLSLQSGIVINTLQEDEECSDRAKVRLRQDCVVQTWHLNHCPVHVDGFEGKEVYFFDPSFTIKDRDCFLTVQTYCIH